MTSSTFNGNLAFTYDAAGRPRTETRPDNTTLTWDHYPDDQLKSLVVAKTSPTSELARWQYNYTNAGQQKTQALTGTPVSAGAGTFSYTYDQAGRLASFQQGTATPKDVRFDADGNRTRYDNEYFDYRADDSLRTTRTGPTGTPVAAAYFDWGGQRSPDGQRTCLAYDGFDRLKTAGTAAVAGDCAGTVTTDATYTYDGLDRQRSRAETVAGTTELHYDGLTSDVVVEKSVTAATDSTYLLGPSGTRHAVTAPLSPLAYYQYWLSDDGHGNISTITNQSAAIACAARFDPYGTPLNPAAPQKVCHTGTNTNTADQSTINDFFYRGGRRDETTDTYQFGARTYNPKQAAFTTPDTYRTGDSATNLSVGVDPLTRNTYSYVNGDPINLVDPDGHVARTTACADAGDGVPYCPTTVTSEGTSGLRRLGTHTPPSHGGVKKGKASKSKAAPALTCPSGTYATMSVPATHYPSTYDQQACMEPGNMPTLSTMVHGTLGTFGFTPGFGIFFDLADGAIYLLQGDLGDAGLAAVAAAPGLGDGAKIARFSDEAVGLARTQEATSLADDAVRTGRSASTAWGRTIQDFKQHGEQWRRVSAHAEAAKGRYRGGMSIEEVFERPGDRLVRHRIYDANGEVLHQTFRPYAKFGAP